MAPCGGDSGARLLLVSPGLDCSQELPVAVDPAGKLWRQQWRTIITPL